MNINNFESHINKTILDRGYDYYIEGNIVETYSNGNNEYIFEIEGSEDYQVVVQIAEDGEILYSECDCPYDYGPICKHQAAAFYELSELLNSKDKTNKGQKEITKQQSLKEVLNNLSKEDLVDIVADLAEKDKTLKNSLMVRYSKGNASQELEKCKKLIDSIVRKYAGREGFIKYRETYDFVSELEELLEKVRDTEDTLLALDIAFLLLNEAIEAFQYGDDSDGYIGSLISETIEVIGETAIDRDDFHTNKKEQIFNKLLEQSDSKVFYEWEEYRIDIFRICIEFADVESLRNKLRAKIEHYINRNSGNEYKEYSNESMLRLLFNMIQKYGTEEEAEKFIKDNLDFTSFRELLIDKYTKEKNFRKIIELALEGEKQDKQYAGLVSKWKKIRYTAYKELSMKEEQGKLAKELLLNGDFEYYKELKALIQDDKTDFYNSLKQELKKENGRRGRDIYLKLILEEKDIYELMEFVRENPIYIEKYAKLLAGSFKDEVIDIYIKRIKSAASSSSNRRDYQGVCGILKRFKNIAGVEKQKIIIEDLTALYKKRPAFIDELGKVR